MTYTDPDRDRRIAELHAESDRWRDLYRETHALWRAGLRQAEAEQAWGVVNAFN